MHLSQFSPVWLAALPLLIAMGIWAVTDLARFLLVAVMASLIIPQSIAQPGGAQVTPSDILFVVLLGGWLIGYSVGRAPRPWLRGNRFVVAAFAFVVFNAESLVWSSNPRSTITFAIQLIEIVLLFPLAFATFPRSLNDMRQGMSVFVLCSSILAMVSVYKYLPNALAGSLAGQSLPYGLNKNVSGSFIGAGLIMAYTLRIGARTLSGRALLGVALAVDIAGLISTVSRGSLIGTMIALAIGSLVLGRSRVKTLGFVAVLVIGYLGIYGTGSQTDTGQAGAYDSSLVRHYSFRNAERKIRQRPILGTGAATYYDCIQETGGCISDPNNMFLLTWAELGLGGLLALAFMLTQYVRILLSMRRLPAEYSIPGVAAGCVTLSLFVHFQVDVTWTRGTTTIAFAMIGLMLAVDRLAATEAARRRADGARTITRPVAASAASGRQPIPA